MVNKVWFRYGIGLLLFFLIIKYFLEINHIFYPIIIVVQSILLPLLLGGFLYYCTVPIQTFLEKRKFKRWQSVLSIMLLLFIAFGIFVSFLGPVIYDQSKNFVDSYPKIEKEVNHYINVALDQRDKLPEDAKTKINDALSKINNSIGKIISNAFNVITSFVSTMFLLILVPFFLIYMLKDHDKFIPFVTQIFKGDQKLFVTKLFKDIDKTLRSYIQGQVTVSIILGVLLLIGYFVIGLKYALILALWGMVTNLIPFLGPYLAIVPAMIIALIQDPIMVVYVIIIMFIAQQLEGNIITPNVMGKSLNIYPLTIITVILAAGNLGGFMAILVAVPTYAVLKVIVTNTYEYILKANEKIKQKEKVKMDRQGEYFES